MTNTTMDDALAPFRVLELGEVVGQHAGKLLADLGAEVIKVEPPSGDAARRQGPFAREEPHPERSLFFAYYNSNKKSITLNLEMATGQELLRRLAQQADAIIECFPPGQMARWGLAYPTLASLNRGLVMASITGFGQEGPYRDYQHSPLVSFAMGGLMFISGEPQQPPVCAPGCQAYDIAGVHAAMGVLIALWELMSSQEGQHIDISIQECMALEEHFISRYSYDGHIVQREGSQHGTIAPSRVFPCKDGFVYISTAGRPGPRNWEVLLELIGRPEALCDPVWQDAVFRRANADVINPFLQEWASTRTREEIVRLGQGGRLPIVSVATPEEFTEDPQAQARGFFVEADHPVIGKHRFPGAPYHLSETPWRLRAPAPLLGEHNREIYVDRLGLAMQELVTLREAGVI